MSEYKTNNHKLSTYSDDAKEDKIRSKKRKKYIKSNETSLINFSFLDYKNDLNRLLQGYEAQEQLINDINDFWLFLNKYENLLKHSGQFVLQKPIDLSTISEDCLIPNEYNKCFNTSIYLTIPFSRLYSRLSNNENLTEIKVQQFLQIVTQYLYFKQKEKFQKIKSLRKLQKNLPIAKYKNEIIDAINSERVIIIAGDTGCGKSTQMPQYLVQAGYNNIACTQPRRIACISLSKRVAYEMLSEYNKDVGYQIRFEKYKNNDTRICFITEGLLLKQLSTEETVLKYDILVLDEVHERNLHGDFLLGVAKCLLKAQPNLKLILMSATININIFINYFNDENAKVIHVPGRLYPIKLQYMPKTNGETINDYQSQSKRLNPEPYIQIMQLVDKTYPDTQKGDLLIFMSGLNEITTIADAAKSYAEQNNKWIIIPLHSSLSIADQDKAFNYAPDGMRKCIVATNIAETSITIDGIRFVIDSGKVKEMSYDPSCKMERLKEFWISKASAEQRKGRAGRTGPGVCYRFYSEKDYMGLDQYSRAEIHRVPLESLLLQMVSMGLPNARLFPFIEAPTLENIENSILALKQHGAMTIDEKLTPLGKALSTIPVEISIGKMLLMGCVFRQLQPVLTLAAALSVQTPFTNRAYRDHECQTARKSLESDHGDPITLLNAHREWLKLKQAQYDRTEHALSTKQWCKRNGLEEQRFYEMTKLRNQFENLLKETGMLEINKPKNLTSFERAIRHGEIKQLKDMKRTIKIEEPQKRKLLKKNSWNIEGNDTEDDKMDIRDVEFRLYHDSSKIENLVSGATACSYRDLMILKLILVSGLYPQIAIADEFNYCKSTSQQFYHTQSKPFTSFHPMSYFGNNPQVLQLVESDIVEKYGLFKSKFPLSSKHQLVCYLSLLETTKPYLMNTLRMPAIQTLLLFSHAIDTNLTMSRLVCDDWLCIDIPSPEVGMNILLKATKLRYKWSKLLSDKLSTNAKNVNNELLKNENILLQAEKLENELWCDLASYMNSDVYYTIRKLLPAELKSLYTGISNNDVLLTINPFCNEFICVSNTTKGGHYLTENITFGCINETDWSIQIGNEIVNRSWECSNCLNIFFITGMEKLQHKKECKKKESITEKFKKDEDEYLPNKETKNIHTKMLKCKSCKQTLYLSSVEVLKHNKYCKK